MARFEGYHTESSLPIKQGQKVVVPAGTLVRSMKPGVDPYLTKAQRTVTVRMLMPGQSVPARLALGDKDYYKPLEAAGYDFTALEKLRDENYAAFSELFVPITNPSITWAGAGGYWCDADINAILEANGL